MTSYFQVRARKQSFLVIDREHAVILIKQKLTVNFPPFQTRRGTTVNDPWSIGWARSTTQVAAIIAQLLNLQEVELEDHLLGIVNALDYAHLHGRGHLRLLVFGFFPS